MVYVHRLHLSYFYCINPNSAREVKMAMSGGKGGGMMYSSPWPQFGQFGQQQQNFGQPRPMTMHCFGKKAWSHNLADGRSQAEREGNGRENFQMT